MSHMRGEVGRRGEREGAGMAWHAGPMQRAATSCNRNAVTTVFETSRSRQLQIWLVRVSGAGTRAQRGLAEIIIGLALSAKQEQPHRACFLL